MMIPEKMNQKLNEQITNEFHAAYSYLSMACALDAMGLKILAKWFLGHSAEERVHGMKILHYVQEVGGTVTLGTMPKPKSDYKSTEDIVQAALDHELLVTRQINDLMALAEEETDYASRSFLQWFVDEQVEEVSLITDLLQLIKMAGDKNMLQVEARVAGMMEVNKG